MCILVSEGGNQILKYIRDHVAELGGKGMISNKTQYRIWRLERINLVSLKAGSFLTRTLEMLWPLRGLDKTRWREYWKKKMWSVLQIPFPSLWAQTTENNEKYQWGQTDIRICGIQYEERVPVSNRGHSRFSSLCLLHTNLLTYLPTALIFLLQ